MGLTLLQHCNEGKICCATQAAKREPAAAYTVLHSSVNADTAMTRKGFKEQIKQWCAAQMPRGQASKVRLSANKSSNDASRWYYRFWCSACIKCTWKGRATYNARTHEAKFAALPATAHSGFQRKAARAGRGLTASTKAIIKAHLIRRGRQWRAQALMQDVLRDTTQWPKPQERQVRKCAENLIARDAEAKGVFKENDRERERERYDGLQRNLVCQCGRKRSEGSVSHKRP